MKKKICLLSAAIISTVLLAVPVSAAKSGVVENNTLTYGGHTYQLFDISTNLDGAEAYCEKLGGHLLTITTSKEQSIVTKLIKKGNKSFYWLGLRQNAKNKFDKWTTGERLKYTNWANNQPDGSGDGAVITNPSSPTSYESYVWHDLREDGESSPWNIRSSGFICEWDQTVYTIQYKLNDGSLRNGDYAYSKTESIKLKTPYRKGYNFGGWFTDKYFTNQITTIKKGSTKNYILYARWIKK